MRAATHSQAARQEYSIAFFMLEAAVHTVHSRQILPHIQYAVRMKLLLQCMGEGGGEG